MSSLITCYPALLINISLLLLLVKGLLINGCSTILSWPWQIWLIFVCPVAKSFTKFKLLNDDNVLDLVKKSAKKFCALNPLLTTLVIECIGVLLSLIKQIGLPSLTLGRNPRWILCWKSMAWIFYLKVTTQLVTFLMCLNWLNIQHPINQLDTSPNGLFPVLHSPYRQHHSAKTALLKVKSDILMIMVFWSRVFNQDSESRTMLWHGFHHTWITEANVSLSVDSLWQSSPAVWHSSMFLPWASVVPNLCTQTVWDGKRTSTKRSLLSGL